MKDNSGGKNGQTFELPLTAPFEITAQSNSDQGYVLRMVIRQGQKTVFKTKPPNSVSSASIAIAWKNSPLADERVANYDHWDMGSTTLSPWVAFIGFLIPILTLAGSAAAYIIKLYQDTGEKRYKRFFELLMHIDGQGSIAAKVGAIYALREFKEHRAFIQRFCEVQRTNVTGDARSNPDHGTRRYRRRYAKPVLTG